MVSSPRPSSSFRHAPTEPAARARPRAALALALLAAGCGGPDGANPAHAAEPGDCISANEGYLRARLQGAIDAEIDWAAPAPQCRGTLRPGGDGVRLVFRGQAGREPANLLLVIGAGPLRAGESARNVPVNLTLVRVGAGQFYATQGDDKCALDEVRQEPVDGARGLFRVEARGYCTSPARAVNGTDAVLVPRFDLRAIVDFTPPEPDPPRPP